MTNPTGQEELCEQEQSAQKQISRRSRTLIYHLMSRLNANHSFDYAETRWKVVLVTPDDDREKSEVRFVFTEKVKQLIEQQHKKYQKNEYVEFAKYKNSTMWEITVRALGVESFYIARLLFMAVNKITNEKQNQKRLDCKLINFYIELAKSKSMNMPPKIKIAHESSGYMLSFPVTGGLDCFSRDNIDSLCFYIGHRFKGYVER